jgi:hypothetical protein
MKTIILLVVSIALSTALIVSGLNHMSKGVTANNARAEALQIINLSTQINAAAQLAINDNPLLVISTPADIPSEYLISLPNDSLSWAFANKKLVKTGVSDQSCAIVNTKFGVNFNSGDADTVDAGDGVVVPTCANALVVNGTAPCCKTVSL